jgi:hypothetical protein
MAIPLHMIHSTFDFEELKYVFSFDLMQPISVFAAGKILLQEYKNNLNTEENLKEYHEKGSFKELITILDKKSLSLSEENKKFSEEHLDVNKLTLSKLILLPNEKISMEAADDIFKSPSVINNHRLNTIFYKYAQINEIYLKLLMRIKKYKDKGFEIKDQENILLNMKYFLVSASSISLLFNSTDIDNTIRQNSLFSGSRDNTEKLKSLIKVTKYFKEIGEEIGVEYQKKNIEETSDKGII